MEQRTTRFSGAEWGDELKEIMLIGCGGIGSWTALNLSRIGHSLILVDMDMVDETNVTGGQMYTSDSINQYKVNAVHNICRNFGCINNIMCINQTYTPEIGVSPITITGLDNMEARKLVFETWVGELNHKAAEGNDLSEWLFIDGRLTMEMYEILCVQGNNEDQLREYEEVHLFSSEEANPIGCTTKQSTFAAMGIAEKITALLCNWLTNRKNGYDVREVPFYQRMVLPIFDFKKQEAECLQKLFS